MPTISYRTAEGLANFYTQNPLTILKKLGGYYECPKNSSGKRLGPLVGYAGTYETGKQYVGDVYIDFAKADQWYPVVNHFAARLFHKLTKDLLHN